MVKDIIKDTEFLSQKCSKFFTGKDDHVIQELLDTAEAHKDHCVGLAAPQIGYHVRAIVAMIDGKFVPFVNPSYAKLGKTYTAEEGCLSLDGTRTVKRNESIMLSFDGPNGKRSYKRFSGYPAQILQHEVDHCNGVLI